LVNILFIFTHRKFQIRIVGIVDNKDSGIKMQYVDI